jgi:hypothetical protein
MSIPVIGWSEEERWSTGGGGANHGGEQASREGVVNLVSFLLPRHFTFC